MLMLRERKTSDATADYLFQVRHHHYAYYNDKKRVGHDVMRVCIILNQIDHKTNVAAKFSSYPNMPSCHRFPPSY